MNICQEYIRKHAEAALLNLQQFAADGDVEAMHQFRVNMKKLRTVFKLIHEIEPNQKLDKKYKKRVKLLFADSGQIRQLHLITHELQKKKFKALLEQSTSLKRLPELTLLFQNNIKKHKRLLVSSKKDVSRYVSSFKEKEIVVFAFALKQVIHKNIVNLTTDEWHELRKQIKQLLCILNLVHPVSRLKILTVVQIKQYDALQELIGSWHDLEDYKNWLMREGFCMSNDIELKGTFSKAWLNLNRQLTAAQKKIQFSIKQMVKRNPELLK